ncbi:MAG TPA: class D sortase [Vicinamibacterales bacterium]|nr:class D sortase [Vicinamibacterales bacterium]
MRWPMWLARVLIGIGCACLALFGIRWSASASFQEAASQALEGRLVAPAPEAEDGLVGRLEISRLHLSVMVVDGDDEATLARAVGHVRGTALPWESGNAVLAGHRDTFFRPLRNLREGDEIRMTTTRGTFDYKVVATEIVEPDDVSVLAPSTRRSLTLITCYPFAYVGRAPQRFIIHAQENDARPVSRPRQ